MIRRMKRIKTCIDGVFFVCTYTPHEAVRMYEKLIKHGYNSELIFGYLKDFGDLTQDDFEIAICGYRAQRHHNIDCITYNTIIYDSICGVIYDELFKQVNLVSNARYKQMIRKGEINGEIIRDKK